MENAMQTQCSLHSILGYSSERGSLSAVHVILRSKQAHKCVSVSFLTSYAVICVCVCSENVTGVKELVWSPGQCIHTVFLLPAWGYTVRKAELLTGVGQWSFQLIFI
jgi:hypothetical protein